MPRPRLCRRVGLQPDVTYFKPAGIRIIDLEETTLTVDEFEAIRLKDLLGLEQEECAKKMGISQPTFHRLILSARKKMADAIVNGKAIRIEGGNFKISQGTEKLGRRRGFGGPSMSCVCPQCGYTEPKVRGVPCASKNCPKCGIPLTRGE